MRRALTALGLAGLLALTACAPESDALVFWAMGAEGENVGKVLEGFRKAHPAIKLKVQGIPWNAAHDKLLTAYAGGVTPDVCQLGTTWVTELSSLGALAPLATHVKADATLAPGDFFAGAWQNNLADGEVWAIPWYVDTRVLFYRKDLLARAGFAEPPATWEAFLAQAKALSGPGKTGAFLPANPGGDPIPLYMAWQQGADLIDMASLTGRASQPAFTRAVDFYVRCFTEGAAPREAGGLTNFYQAFAAGDVAMFVSGPWNVGALREKMPELAGKWAVARLPATRAGGPRTSVAGGSALAVFKRSRRQDEAWALISYLARPEVQREFHALTGDLPARKSAWRGQALEDPVAKAFYAQMQDARPVAAVPEWELLATKLGAWVERAVYGELTVEAAMRGLDGDIDRALEKRRWLASRRKVAP